MSGLKLRTAYLQVISVSLITAVLAQPPLNGPLPIRVSPLVISGGEGSQSCPASGILESARRNLSESIHSSIQGLLAGEVVPDCGSGNWIEVVHFDMSNASQQCPSSWTMASSPARSYALLPHLQHAQEQFSYHWTNLQSHLWASNRIYVVLVR